jgi:RNA polymerase sigma factor (TIGR02999 family)
MTARPAAGAADLDALLARVRQGDDEAVAAMVPLVYDELRRIAARHMRRERPGQTIQATALVHEAYLRLLKDKKRAWQNRAHFLAIAATSMRQILVERARARGATKRGGGAVRLTLDEATLAMEGAAVDLEAIDEALRALGRLDPRQARIVELRFFGGLSVEEAAEVIGISPGTLKREWSVARAWLRRALETEGAGGS